MEARIGHVKNYRKIPVEIQAMEFTPDTALLVRDWLVSNGAVVELTPSGKLAIKTLEGVMTASSGDMVIRGVRGEFYPCKPEIFRGTYQEV